MKETPWKHGSWISTSDYIQGTRKGNESTKIPKQLEKSNTYEKLKCYSPIVGKQLAKNVNRQ